MAIERERGVGRLACALGVRQSVVSNWRSRGLPRSWRLVLEMKYGGGDVSQDSPQNPPAVLDLQARPAIKTVAQEVANA